MIFMATNRLPKGGVFSNDRNPNGNMWWTCPNKPLDQKTFWSPIAESGALALIEQQAKPVVLFVHGFNESWQRDMDVTQAVFDGLGDKFTIVAFSWDSLGSELAYLQDRERAEKSAADLLEVLKALDCPNVVAHSMGNFVLQKALDLVKGSPQVYINGLAMVAADVPFNVLAHSNIAQAVKDGVILWCQFDPALASSGIIHGFVPRLGFSGPLGTNPKNFTSVECTGKLPAELNPVDLHGAYFKSPACYELIKQAFQ